jgi:hypothetical protein
LVRANNRGIQQYAFLIELDLQAFEDRFPVPLSRPLGEAVVDGLPWAKSRRKVSPRRSGLESIEDRIDEEAVSQHWCGPPACWQNPGQQLPLRVGQCMAVRHSQL